MTGDDLPYVRVFRGMIADYYDGVVDDEGMMNAMGLLSRDDVATSLGMDAVDMGELDPNAEPCDRPPCPTTAEDPGPAPIDPGRARRLILKLAHTQ